MVALKKIMQIKLLLNGNNVGGGLSLLKKALRL